MAQHVALTPISNREDWDDTFELFDVENDTALDLTAVTAITLVVWDDDIPGTSVLSASLSDGITIDDITGGTISIHFDAADVSAVIKDGKSYSFRIGMVNGGATKDLMIGTVPFEYGGPE